MHATWGLDSAHVFVRLIFLCTIFCEFSQKAEPTRLGNLKNERHS
jgi:hypothetical protein